MAADALPLTGTCELSTVGRRSGRPRRVEIWYVVVDGQVVVTGTPGGRHWLANLRENPGAVLHLRAPHRDLAVRGTEVVESAARRRVAEVAWRLQPWYAEQPYSLEQWVADSPMMTLVPAPSEG
jgi:deazaflavin-dependent oxidoreductase (nitroreductase family)